MLKGEDGVNSLECYLKVSRPLTKPWFKNTKTRCIARCQHIETHIDVTSMCKEELGRPAPIATKTIVVEAFWNSYCAENLVVKILIEKKTLANAILEKIVENPLPLIPWRVDWVFKPWLNPDQWSQKHRASNLLRQSKLLVARESL